MNETQNQNPLSNQEEMDKLILELKTELSQEKQKAETWKNGKIKTEQSLFEKERVISRLQEDVETLKRENLAQRRIELDHKETKNKNQTLELFTQKLDAKIKEVAK
jgi:hypothetical protein